MKRKTGKQLILLLFLLFAVTALQNFIQQRSRASLLHTDTCFTESFREQALSPLLYQQLEAGNYTDGEFADLLTATMLNQRFYPKKISGDNCPYLRFKQGHLERPGNLPHSRPDRDGHSGRDFL